MYKEFAKIIKHEMVPALGCTDPIGIAFTAAKAAKYIEGEILSVNGCYSGNLIKNVKAVLIPGTDGLCGADIATALGVTAGDSDKGLEALAGITPQQVKKAVEFRDSGKVTIEKAQTDKKLFMKVTVKSESGSAEVTVEDQYTHITSIIVNGEEKYRETSSGNSEKDELRYDLLSIDNIIDFTDNAEDDELEHIVKAIQMNTALAEAGLDNDFGMGTGRFIRDTMSCGGSDADMSYCAAKWVSAGIDARMAGCVLPAMSNTDSGNQGIACTMLVAGAAKALDTDAELVVRATALSCLMAIYIKSRLGALSTVCGGVVACTGGGCGIAYLQGGRYDEILAVMKNMFGNLAGLICDGAKSSCALKMATCTNAACMAAGLAMEGRALSGDAGIVGSDETETIDNFIKTSNDGLEKMDAVVLDIVMSKKEEERK